MSSAFSGDTGWYSDAKRQIETEYRLKQITEKQYNQKLEMLWKEKQEDSFY